MQLIYKEDMSPENLTVTDALLLLALDQDKPLFSVLSLNIFSSAFTSVIMELDVAKIIAFEGVQKNLLDDTPEIKLLQELPPAYASCQTIYQAIVESKHKTIKDIATIFLGELGSSRIQKFAEERLNRLRALQAVQQTSKKNWWGRESHKDTAQPEFVDLIVQDLREELLGPATPSEAVLVLSLLLEKANLLQHYFSAHEQTKLKERVEQSRTALAGQGTAAILGEVDKLLIYIASLLYTTFMA